MSEHLLSIIIPVYNGEAWLSRCIESVLAQRGGIAWEMILVNDGSTDESEKICREYADGYENIRYVRQKNAGVYRARICGIGEAQGDWIMFMDQDDTLVTDAFVMIKNVWDDEVEIVVFDFNNIIGDIVKPRRLLKKAGVYRREEFEQLLHFCLVDDSVSWSIGMDDIVQSLGAVWSRIFQRNLFQTKKLPDLDGVFWGDDHILFNEALHCADKIGYVSHPFYNYYRQSASESQGFMRKGRKAEEIIHNFEVYRKYILRHVDSKNPNHAKMLIGEYLYICKMCFWNRALNKEDAEKIFSYCYALVDGFPQTPKQSEIGWVNYLLYFCIKHRMKQVLWLLVWMRRKMEKANAV